MPLSGEAEQKVCKQELENDLDKCAVLDLPVILTLDGRSRAQKEPSIFEMEQTEAMGSSL